VSAAFVGLPVMGPPRAVRLFLVNSATILTMPRPDGASSLKDFGRPRAGVLEPAVSLNTRHAWRIA